MLLLGNNKQFLAYLPLLRVSQSVHCLTMDWMTGQSRFGPWQRQDDFPLTSVSRPALGPTQPPVQWVPEVLSPEGKAWPGLDADH
jgi:hypothetical protein